MLNSDMINNISQGLTEMSDHQTNVCQTLQPLLFSPAAVCTACYVAHAFQVVHDLLLMKITYQQQVNLICKERKQINKSSVV